MKDFKTTITALRKNPKDVINAMIKHFGLKITKYTIPDYGMDFLELPQSKRDGRPLELTIHPNNDDHEYIFEGLSKGDIVTFYTYSMQG